MNKTIQTLTPDLPLVVLCGRVNVGKSTLYNKLSGAATALVSKIPGTTRDTGETLLEWQDMRCRLVDTGGIMEEKFLAGVAAIKNKRFNTTDINALAQLQAAAALRAADIIMLVVDAKSGPLEQDRRLALALKKMTAGRRRLMLVVNKTDTAKDRAGINEFYALGWGEPLAVSAATGSGTGDLLDAVAAAIKNLKLKTDTHVKPVSLKPQPAIRVVILGKPNVGKSSLLNAIAGEDAVIVSPTPHTTREPRDISVSYQPASPELKRGEQSIFTFVDTAGIVKKTSKINRDVLIKSGMSKSLATLKRADIALLVVDITADLTHQETKLADAVLNSNTNLIIVANKWDAIADKDTKSYSRAVYSSLPFVQWAPIVFLSARNRTKLTLLLDTIVESVRARNHYIDPRQLTEFLAGAQRHALPLSNTKIRGILKNKLPKPQLKKLQQTQTNPPVFTLTAKTALGIKGNYITYLENRLRQEFKLTGTPVKVVVEEI